MEPSGAGWKMGMIDEQHGIFEFIKSLPPWLGGVVMAFFVALLRVVYDREDDSKVRALTEAAICGGLTLAIGSGVEAAGFGNGWHLAIGGFVGALGSKYVRSVAMKLIHKKAGKHE